jgi:hypothetical protein
VPKSVGSERGVFCASCGSLRHVCVESWCDMLGSRACHVQRPRGRVPWL